MSAEKSEKLVSFKDLYRKKREQADASNEVASSAGIGMPDSLPGDNRLPSPDSLPGDGSLPRPAPAYHPGSLPGDDSLPSPGSPEPDLWAPFRDLRGHYNQPHAYTDGLCQVLDVYEQAVFTQLSRLSHGFHKDTCKIGLPQLARRANVSKSTAQAAVGRLIQKSLVRKVNVEFGSDKEQGTVYWVSSPGSLPGAGRLPGAGTNKIKALKEKSKKGAHVRRDFAECPDCFGTGMYYPDGFDKGVTRCRHEKLKEGASSGFTPSASEPLK